MIKGNALPQADLPDSPHARQLKAGFPWLTFEPALESEYRQTVLEEHLPYIRVNLGLVILAIGMVSALRFSTAGRR